MDDLNFGQIYDDCMAIWKCLSTSRIFVTASFSPGFKGKRKGRIENLIIASYYQYCVPKLIIFVILITCLL